MRRRRLALIAAVLAAAVGAPAAAQTPVDVIVGNGGGRTLYVEELTGAPLETLDFGALRTLPFRVRVVDDAFDRENFTVLASMTNLYRDADGALDFDERIDSVNLEIANPQNPLDAADVSAQVQPVFDVTVEVAGGAACLLLGLGGLTCEVVVPDLPGKLQTLDAVVDLADLSSLPLVPSAPEPGTFDDPDYVGDAEDDPAKPGTFTPTQRRLLGGEVTPAASLLSALQSDLDALVDATPVDELVDTDALLQAIGDQLDLPLTDDVVAALLGGTTTLVAEALTAADLLYQTGTYTSYPLLKVTVPEAATNGTYLGTLVVTGIES